MGKFTSAFREAAGSAAAESDFLRHLGDTKGLVRVASFTIGGTYPTGDKVAYDERISAQANGVLAAMQEAGFEVIDTDFESVPMQKLTGKTMLYRMVVRYR